MILEQQIGEPMDDPVFTNDPIHNYLVRRIHKMAGDRFRLKDSAEQKKRHKNARKVLEDYDAKRYARVLQELTGIRDEMRIEWESLLHDLGEQGVRVRRRHTAYSKHPEFEVLSAYIATLRKKIASRRRHPANDR